MDGGEFTDKLGGDLSPPFFYLCYFDETCLLENRDYFYLAAFPYLETVKTNYFFSRWQMKFIV